MEFTHKKLPPEAAETLRLCPIRSVAPFALMLAPVYVYMKMNQKFVCVKAPLDFFTSEELERLDPFQAFFIPEFVDSALPFREAARRVRSLLSWQPRQASETEDNPYPPAPLPPTPFELSDAVLRIIGPLWGDGAVIEPFFVAIFANEICELLPGEMMRAARDSNVELFERAIFRSAWAVFLALHLGYCNLDLLNRLRFRVFEETLNEISPRFPCSEIDELIAIVAMSLETSQTRTLNGDIFNGRPERVSQKISARMARVKSQMILHGEPAPTIYGLKGFIDV